MHEVELVDPTLFEDSPQLFAVDATPELTPDEIVMKHDVQEILADFPDLFSIEKHNLSKIVNHDIFIGFISNQMPLLPPGLVLKVIGKVLYP